MRILRPALLYFVIVFGTGFILGPIRLLLVVPRVGVRTAELLEAPIMLAVTIIASRWIVRRFPELSSRFGRLAMGSFALLLMLGAEFLLAWILQGNSIRESVAAKDPVSGSVYYALLLVFAVLPALWKIDARSS